MSPLTREEATTAPLPGASTDEVRALVRAQLLKLAASETDLAATEAAAIPYWGPTPSSVAGHRAAAAAAQRRRAVPPDRNPASRDPRPAHRLTTRATPGQRR